MRRLARLGVIAVLVLALPLVFTPTAALAYDSGVNVRKLPPVKSLVTTVAGVTPTGRALKGAKTALSLAMLGQTVYAQFGDGFQKKKDVTDPAAPIYGEPSQCRTQAIALSVFWVNSGVSDPCYSLESVPVTINGGTLAMQWWVGWNTNNPAGYVAGIRSLAVPNVPPIHCTPSPNGSSQNCHIYIRTEMQCPVTGGTIALAASQSWNSGTTAGVPRNISTTYPKASASTKCANPWQETASCIGFKSSTSLGTLPTSCATVPDWAVSSGQDPAAVINFNGAGQATLDMGMSGTVVCDGDILKFGADAQANMHTPGCVGGADSAQVEVCGSSGCGTLKVIDGDIIDYSQGGCTSILSCELDVQVIIQGNWMSCFAAGPPPECGTWYSRAAEGLARCTYGGAVVSRDDCYHMKDGWKRDPKIDTETKIGTKLDPEGELGPTPTNTPAPTPSPSPTGTPGPNPIPTPATNPNPHPEEDCWSGFSFNMVDMVADGAKCALSWAFVPKAAPTFGDIPSPLPPGWLPTFPGLTDGSCGTVTMPSLNLGPMIPSTGAKTFFDTCQAPWPLVRTFTYYGLLASVLVTVGNRALRAAMTSLGMGVDSPSGGGGDDD